MTKPKTKMFSVSALGNGGFPERPWWTVRVAARSGPEAKKLACAQWVAKDGADWSDAHFSIKVVRPNEGEPGYEEWFANNMRKYREE